MKIKRCILKLGIILAYTACASTKTNQPEQAVIVYAPDQLGEMPQDEPPMEITMVEELPPPIPDVQYTTTTLAEQKAAALADTTVFPASKLEVEPTFYHNGQNLAFYLEEQVKNVKAASGIKESGTITIKAVVERDGSLTNLSVVSSPANVLTKHSLAILKQMPKWRPGSLNGWERRAYATLSFYW